MLDKGFYGFDIKSKSQSKILFLAIALALSIIAIILFPLWPFTVKLAIYNVLFYFSASLLGLIFFRLILYIVLFPFGIDFWIFPNMFDDDLGLMESFLPFLLINRRVDEYPMVVFRIFLVAVFALY